MRHAASQSLIASLHGQTSAWNGATRTQEYAMLFLVWYDPDAGHSVGEKIQDALAAYGRRFSAAPNLVLVSADATAEVAGVEVRSTRTVQPHHFWVGRSEEQGGVVEAEG